MGDDPMRVRRNEVRLGCGGGAETVEESAREIENEDRETGGGGGSRG
jgi:hypothetical protein